MEEWREVDNLNKYKISNLGRIKSKARIVRCNTGVLETKEIILKNQTRGKRGFEYNCVRLTDNKGYTKTYSVHRLVAEAFIPNPENKPTVDHINRDRLDNRVENLRWATYIEQQLNKKATGLKKKIKSIDKEGNETYYSSIREASNALNIDEGTISKVISDKYINKTAGGFKFESSEN